MSDLLFAIALMTQAYAVGQIHEGTGPVLFWAVVCGGCTGFAWIAGRLKERSER